MSELVLSVAGFLTIAGILLLLNRKVVSPYVAIAGVPMITCILIGHGAHLGDYITKGLGSVATTGIMFIFSVIFFGVISETGAFEPFINTIIKATKGDPVRLIIGVFFFAMLVHLDGSGVVTVLLVVPAMFPIFKKLHMRNTALALPLGLAAGIMNAVPWGGPTLRAATALKMDVMELWIPFIPTQIFGLFAALIICIFVGRGEKKRLISEGILQEGTGFNFEEFSTKPTEEQLKMRRPNLIVINWCLIIGVLGLMVSSVLAPVVSFMIGVCLALIINYRDPQVQRNLIEEKGKDAILLCSVIFAAGILMGIMGQSGMSEAMANMMVRLIPSSFSEFLAPIIGVLSVPLSILFDPDSYYYGIMPIIVEVAEALGVNGVNIARASIIGQVTLGWPLCPMIGTFFLFTGMCELDIGEWQKYAFKYFFLVGVLMTAFAWMTGLFR
ncbi:MAG: citrate transporter [Lachnoclostridium sp.]|nr:citrate transporter [Lachnoclostridium sp.]